MWSVNDWAGLPSSETEETFNQLVGLINAGDVDGALLLCDDTIVVTEPDGGTAL